jgi:predicted Na+-dependent transporter
VIPIVLARLVAGTFLKKVVEMEGTYISIVILFLLIWGSIAPVGLTLVYDWTLVKVLLLVVLMVLANLCVGLWLGSDWKAKKTYAISLSYKNFTLAMVLALTLFGPMAALPAAVYTLVNNLMLVPLQWLWGQGKK